MSQLQELDTFAAVEEAIGAAPHVLLDMWGTFCAPCRALRPILEELAEKRSDWRFVAVNIEDVPAVAEKFGVQATPTILLFAGGVEVDRTGGFIMPADLTARMGLGAAGRGQRRLLCRLEYDRVAGGERQGGLTADPSVSDRSRAGAGRTPIPGEGTLVAELLGIDLPTGCAVVLATVGICLTLLVLVRLGGTRSLAMMSAADIACLVALGAVVGRTTLLAVPTLTTGVIALVVLFGLQRLLAGLERRPRWGRLLSRPPVVLLSDGEVHDDALCRARLSENDLRQRLRLAGVVHRSEVRLVVLERTGQISVLCGAPPERWMTGDLDSLSRRAGRG